jgi:signal transduction histidine kinase/putative methionine-R-sulfoxide reductase with GAF domain
VRSTKYRHRAHSSFQRCSPSLAASPLRLRDQVNISNALIQISSALNGTLDLARLCQLVVDTAQQFIPKAEGVVLHRLENDISLVPVAVSGVIAPGGQSVHLELGQGAAGTALVKGELVTASDVYEDPLVIPPYPGSPMRSLMVAPLRSHNINQGTISVISSTPAAFSHQDERLIWHLAGQAAIATHNANLFEQERQHSLLVEVLAQGAVVLNRRLDLNVVLDEILDQILQVIPCPFVNIMLIQGGRLVMARSRTDALDAHSPDPPPSLPLDMPTWKFMLATRSALLISDTDNDPRWIPLPGREWIRSYLGLPLQIGNDVIGFLSLNQDHPYAFTHTYARALTWFAAHAAIAIYNSQLYQELCRSLEHERTMRDQLIRSDRLASMGRLTASLAHEINNPLQGIKSSLERAIYYFDRPEKQVDFLARAGGEVTRVADLVRLVLDFHRPAQEYASSVDLSALVGDVLILSAQRAKRGRVKLVENWSPDMPQVEGRPAQLKQVFLNLVLNALEGMSNGGELCVSGSCDLQEGWVEVVLADTGAGIEPEDLPHIFEPFFSTKDTGTGLGLWISHSIVSAHGGQLVVDSEPGSGTRVVVKFPVNKEEVMI